MSERTKFWMLVGLLIASIILAILAQKTVDQSFIRQF